MSTVTRFDLRRFSPKVQKTPQGFVRAPAHFTRAGVFTYSRADGTTVRELRPEEEVFNSDSMASLSGAPVVVDHPSEMWVDPSNARKLSVGWTGESIERQDTHLAGSVIVMDADTISKIGTELCEISMGYRCRIDKTPGEHPEFGRYDQIQRDIRYNHTALGPSGWGRAGRGIGLRLDKDSAITYFDGDDPGGNPDSQRQRKDFCTMKIKINGVSFDVEENVAEALQAERKRFDTVSADFEKLQGRHDAQAEKIQKLEADLAEANDPARFDAAVTSRLDLVSKARKVLGAEAEIQGSGREIMEAVIKNDREDLDLSSRSDDYVESRFDALLEGLDAQELERDKAEKGKLKARADAHKAKGGDSDGDNGEIRVDAEKSRKEMKKRNMEAWQQPLSVTQG